MKNKNRKAEINEKLDKNLNNLEILSSKYLNRRNLKRNKEISSIQKNAEKLKLKLITKIKNRSKRKKISNEISKDIEKIEMEPKDLILIDYINKKISNE